MGHYSYNIVVFDTSGNTASDSVEITVVDTTDPTLSSPDDVQFKEGDSGYNLTWILIDVNPQSYEIFMDLTLIASGLWNSTGETITISLDDLLEGVHHLTIYVSDLAGNEASDMIIVTVLPSTPDGPSGDSALQPIIILGIGLGCGVFISVIVVFILRRK
ncbi:MAG: hypothetical protein ACW99U_18985 [Candidatus Thorarchaeota archaeon]